MQTNLISKEGVAAKFEVTVSAPEVDKSYSQVISSVSRQVRIPGFRPGKAPKGMLIKQIGQDALDQEVRDALVEEYYPKAVSELGLTPVHANFSAKEPAEGSDYTFEVEVDLYPDFELPDLSEIVIDSAAPALTDAMVEEAAQNLQRENATHIPVERPVEADDYVLLETVRDDDDSGEPATLPIDLETAGDAFVEQLLGKSMGDTVELDLSAGADDELDDEDEDEDGAEAVSLPKLKVIIKDVKEKEKPELDDEFAKTLGFDTWEEVDAKIRENIQAQLDAEAFEEQREEFTDKLVAETELELPQSLINHRKVNLLDNLKRDLEARDLTFEDYLAQLDEDEGREAFEQELQEAAEEGVKRDLVLERLLEQRETQLSDEEFSQAVVYLAMQERQEPQQFVNERGREWLQNYRFLLRRDKAVREVIRELLGLEDEEANPTTDAEETEASVVGTAEAGETENGEAETAKAAVSTDES